MYTFDSRVRYSEIDPTGQLSVTSIINYFQDCSTLQSEDIGKGIVYLQQQQRAWWLSSWQIVVDHYPVLGDPITIATWPYGFKGMYGYRNFVILDKAGRHLVRANSVWFFFDTKAGKPVRVGAADLEGYGTGYETPLEMDYAKQKIAFWPAESKVGKAIVIDRHHIDTNRHVNNAQYVAIAQSLLLEDFVVGEVRVDYKKAAVQHDIIIPYQKDEQDCCTIGLCDFKKEPYAVVWLKRKG